MKTKKKDSTKWYNPTIKSGWSKTDSQVTRRKKALKAHKGDYLSTAYSLQSLANVTKDEQTKTKAISDAKHFFALHKKTKK